MHRNSFLSYAFLQLCFLFSTTVFAQDAELALQSNFPQSDLPAPQVNEGEVIIWIEPLDLGNSQIQLPVDSGKLNLPQPTNPTDPGIIEVLGEVVSDGGDSAIEIPITQTRIQPTPNDLPAQNGKTTVHKKPRPIEKRIKDKVAVDKALREISEANKEKAAQEIREETGLIVKIFKEELRRLKLEGKLERHPAIISLRQSAKSEIQATAHRVYAKYSKP